MITDVPFIHMVHDYYQRDSSIENISSNNSNNTRLFQSLSAYVTETIAVLYARHRTLSSASARPSQITQYLSY